MSDGMSEYWKNKKIRDQEMRDESIARQARDAVARVLQRPDLQRRKNPILFVDMGAGFVSFDDAKIVLQKDIAKSVGIEPIEVLGKLEVEEVPTDISAVRYTKKE